MTNHLKMELTALSALQVPAVVPRIHNREKRRKLAAHIKKYGQLVPILIENGGLVVDGHARAEAAAAAGLTDIYTIDVSHLPEADRRALRISVNKLAEGGVWDKQSLARELSYLIEVGYDLEFTGLNTVEIESTLQIGDTPADVEELDTKLMVDPVVSGPGDIWILSDGRRQHRVACGDFRDEALFPRLFRELQASACFTDPPYNVRISNNVSGTGKHAEFAMGSGEMSDVEFATFLRGMVKVLLRELARNGVLFICMDWRHIRHLLAAAEAEGLELLNLAVWVKSNAGMGSFYRSQHELVAVLKRPGEQHRNNVELGRHGRSRSNVWEYRGVNVMGPERHLLDLHPTVKPSALVADAIRDVTQPGEIVFDPFLGSGTTLIAAERTQRICYGIEIEPKFVDLAVRRWQAETGREAIREVDGVSFSEAAIQAGQQPASSAEVLS